MFQYLCKIHRYNVTNCRLIALHILFFVVCNGGNSCCSKEGYLCEEHEGNCNSDSDCAHGLKCGSDNCKRKRGFQWDMDDDCCFDPKGSE